MQFEPGDTILVVSTFDDPDSVKEYVFKSRQEDWLICEGVANIFLEGYCFPLNVMITLKTILQHRAELKKEYEDSIQLIYELRNNINNS